MLSVLVLLGRKTFTEIVKMKGEGKDLKQNPCINLGGSKKG